MEDKTMMTGQNNRDRVLDDRILYTPSSFARASLLHLQEAGRLTARIPHTSQREKLRSCLCFVVLKGRGELSYGSQSYSLSKGNVVFIDCQKGYAHSTGSDSGDLWTLQWCHFYGPSLAAVYAKYQERGGQPVLCPGDSDPYTKLLQEIYQVASSDDYIRDMRINEKLNILLTHLMSESWNPGASLGSEGGEAAKRDIQQVKAYMDEHYREKITLDFLAENFFINKYYLARLFKE